LTHARYACDAQQSPEIETAYSALRFRAFGLAARASMLLRDNHAGGELSAMDANMMDANTMDANIETFLLTRLERDTTSRDAASRETTSHILSS
jgi:hypothetical protein